MSINYQLIADGYKVIAEIKNLEIPESLNTVGYAPSLYQRGTEKKLLFDTCIISTISEIFYKTSPNVTQIEVKNSIVDRIDLDVLIKFPDLEEITFVDSTLNELSGTVFGELKNFTLSLKTDQADDKVVGVIVNGEIFITDSEQKDEEVQGKIYNFMILTLF
jgi:hypothetical protein